MTSEPGAATALSATGRTGAGPDAFVWVWLSGQREPVLAGRLRNRPGTTGRSVTTFTYARRYLDRGDAMSLYAPELPLQSGPIDPVGRLSAPGVITDSGPDSWGQRVIIDRHARTGASTDPDLLTFLLESGSDRIGALDFQPSADVYEPRGEPASLEELQTAAARLDSGEPLTPELDRALVHGTSIGGARPKALLQDRARQLIAKFSSASDARPVVRAEAAAMDLANLVGLDVAPTQLVTSLGKDVLLVERFDRPAGGGRRMMVSALTMLGADELEGRYLTYPDLGDVIRRSFADPMPTLRELFARIVFNICVGNNDDHARNHAAFWDGRTLRLTPAYDICPQLRSNEMSTQAMAIGRDGSRESRLGVCLAAANDYLLSRQQAQDIIDHQVTTITEQWDQVAERARLTTAEKSSMWGRQILNPFAFQT